MPEQPTIQTVRLYVDEELTASQRADFEAALARDPGLGRRVEAERALRQRVAAALTAAHRAAPPAVRARASSALRRVAGRSVLASLFAGPQRASIVAVAATLALVAGAVLLGIFGPSIDEVAQRRADLVSDPATWISGEHGRCAGDADALRGRAIWAPEALAIEGQRALGEPMCVFNLADCGYQIVGGGPCAVPGAPRSCHLIYSRDGSRSPKASLFVTPLPADDPLAETPLRWQDAGAGPECNHKVLRITDGRLEYYLVCCRSDDLGPIAGAILGQLLERRSGPAGP
jgi:anti-sigma factor RsiW